MKIVDMHRRIRHRVATAARQRHKSGSTSEPYRSEENRDGEEEGEEEWQEAQAKCSIHEADEPERNARQDKKNRRMINADDKLKSVFGGRNQVSMFEMTKLVSRHLK